MKIRTSVFSILMSGFATMMAFSANAIELTTVQKKLDQFKEVNSCTGKSRGSQFPSVFLYFDSKNTEIFKIDRAVLKSDFSEFEIGFDHKKEEYFYKNIFGKDKHYEQIHKICDSESCQFNMIVYPEIVFPEDHDNTDIQLTFYDKDNNVISKVEQNIGRFDPYEFRSELVPFDAYMENGVVVARKLPSDHPYEHYVVGLHIGLDGKKQEIDVVVNKNQAEEGVIIGYPGYSDIDYIGVYFEKNQYDDHSLKSTVENKIELYDAEKEFFKNCEPK